MKHDIAHYNSIMTEAASNLFCLFIKKVRHDDKIFVTSEQFTISMINIMNMMAEIRDLLGEKNETV